MNLKRAPLILGVIILLTTVGCIGPDPGRYDEISYSGSFNTTDGGFEMNGEITRGGGVDVRETYHNITVELYTAESKLLYAENIGALSGRTNISISIAEMPHYIIIRSPDFWIENVEVAYYEQTDYGAFREEFATARDDLPVNDE